MQFYSTNGQCRMASLEEAVMTGLAPDGGLFMPERIPVIPRAFFNNIGEMNIREIAYVVADLMLGQDIESADIQRIVNETFSFDIPLVKLSDSIFSLELFHGPTKAFKDVGARFLARIISHYTDGGDRPIKVLVATSGDSGGAVADGFLNVPGVDVYVVYPAGGLTAVQRSQFVISDSNIHAVEVIGTFDDCQRMVKECFVDSSLREDTRLTSANSINICRLLPQMFYFFHAYASLIHITGDSTSPIVMSVPCGNLGNLTAGLLAYRMGLPVDRFVVANNRNDVTVDYLLSGRFAPRRAVRTVACAMDVGNPSNMDRILDLFGDDHSGLCRLLHGYKFDDGEILSTITDTYSIRSYLADPHGATALRALFKDLKPGEKGIFLETAHPCKFPRAIADATGVKFPPLAEHHSSKVHIPRISSTDALKKILLSPPTIQV